MIKRLVKNYLDRKFNEWREEAEMHLRGDVLAFEEREAKKKASFLKQIVEHNEQVERGLRSLVTIAKELSAKKISKP